MKNLDKWEVCSLEEKVKGIQIISTGIGVPKNKVTNDDLSKIVETDDEWISTRTGIKTRFKCEEESCSTLAIQAAKQAIERAGINKDDIGAIIVATSTPDYVFPSVACLVQKELEIPEEVIAFDLSAACSGFLFAMQTVHGLINNMDKPYALIVGSEQLSRIVDYTDRSTCILFGDGAGAAIIGKCEETFVAKSWSRGNIENLNCPGVGNNNSYISMKGSDVFKFAVTALAQAIEEVLKKANSTLDEIDYVVCHQANSRIIEHVKKKYPDFKDKFFMNIEKYGNTSAASIPIALDELVGSHSGEGVKKVLCVGFGAGLTWSGAIVNCNMNNFSK